MGSNVRAVTIDDLLAEARARLECRAGPGEVEAALGDGALVVDIRPVHQRQASGQIPGSMVIDRNVLEWRLDPSADACLPEASFRRRIIVVCEEGYASSLAAATLVELGLRATDLDGGVQAWVSSGRPTVPADSSTASSSSP
jgi:rhodanese-related sulfurtransferase